MSWKQQRFAFREFMEDRDFHAEAYRKHQSFKKMRDVHPLNKSQLKKIVFNLKAFQLEDICTKGRRILYFFSESCKQAEYLENMQDFPKCT